MGCSSVCSGGVEGLSATSASEPGDFALLRGELAEVIEDCRLVEFDAEDVVESSTSSTTFHVCSVASGANDTRRLAIDFRRAARCSSIACFSDFLLSSASSSRAEASCSSSVLTATVLPFGLLDLVMGLNGSRTFSTPPIGPRTACVLALGAGVEKSMRRSPASFLVGDFPLLLPVLLLRVSSKVGIAFGGVRGIAGFKMDLIANVGDG